MSSRSSLLAVLAIAIPAIPACSCSTDLGTNDAGSDAPVTADAPVTTDAPVLTDASDAPRVDAPVTPDSGGGDAGTAYVAWTTEPEPVTIDSDIGLDFFYQYEVYLVGDVFSYTLDMERCFQIAGMAESCETVARDPLAFSSGIRWGIDPSMYAVGENHYRFMLTLRQGTTVVSEDTIELVATVTSCTECVGS